MKSVDLIEEVTNQESLLRFIDALIEDRERAFAATKTKPKPRPRCKLLEQLNHRVIPRWRCGMGVSHKFR